MARINIDLSSAQPICFTIKKKIDTIPQPNDNVVPIRTPSLYVAAAATDDGSHILCEKEDHTNTTASNPSSFTSHTATKRSKSLYRQSTCAHQATLKLVQPVSLHTEHTSSHTEPIPVHLSKAESFQSISPAGHTVHPFTEPQIDAIVSHLRSTRQYRELMYFIVGINFGLRYSDLSRIRFGDLIDSNNNFRSQLVLSEQKTSKKRTIYCINDAVRESITLYLQCNDCSQDDYLFSSRSNNSKGKKQPLTRRGFENILKRIVTEADLDPNLYNTHSLRKTFGHMFVKANGYSEQSICTLQRIFGHSDRAVTLLYIGIVPKMMEQAYSMSLGGSKEYSAESSTNDANVKHDVNSMLDANAMPDANIMLAAL